LTTARSRAYRRRVSSRAQEQAARGAGRGFLFILAAKLYFLVAGYAIVVSLNWLLDRAAYGLYGLVVGSISVLDNVIVTGTIQSVSRFTAQDDAKAGAIKAAALRLQLIFGGGVAIAFALTAPLIARFERDPGLTPYLRLAAAVVFAYALYSVFVGSANGQRRFGLQAGLDVLYATLRGALIVGLAAWMAVWGAVSGFVIASILIVVIAAFTVGVRDLGRGFPTKPLIRFALPVMAYLLLVNLAMFMDLFLIKRLAGQILEAGLGAADVANEQAGGFVAVQQLARISYQAMLSVTFVIFPLISRTTFDQDRETTRRYVTSTMRDSLILAGGISVVFAALPEQILAVPFRPEYQVGAPALAVLAPGYGAFSLFMVSTTILNAAGRARLALAVAAALLLTEGLACWLLIPTAQTPRELLLAAATGAAGGMAMGWLLASLALYRAFGAGLSALSLLRVAVAFAVAVLFGGLLPQGSRLLTVAECVAVGLVYLTTLALSAEVGRADLRRGIDLIRRRRG
jgi:stage V sporulation protein B